MLLFNSNEINLLAQVVDDYFCDKNSSYQALMEDISLEYIDPFEALIEFFGYIVMTSPEHLEESIKLFFEISFEQMPLYVTSKPNSQLKVSSTLCPTLEEGPYPWQSILARWRIKIQK